MAVKFFLGKTAGFENELNEYRRMALKESGPNPFDRLNSSSKADNQLGAPKNEDLNFSAVVFRSAILFLFHWLAFLVASVLFVIILGAVRKITGLNMKASSSLDSLLYVLIPMYAGQYLATRKWRPSLMVMIFGSAAFISSVLGVSILLHQTGTRSVILLIHSMAVPAGIFIGLCSKRAFRFRKPPETNVSQTQPILAEFGAFGQGDKPHPKLAGVRIFLLVLFVYFVTSLAGLIVFDIASGIVRKELGITWDVLGYPSAITIFLTSILVGFYLSNRRWRPDVSLMLLGGIMFIALIVDIRLYVNPYDNYGEFSLFYDTLCIPLGVLFGTWLVRGTPKIRHTYPTI